MLNYTNYTPFEPSTPQWYQVFQCTIIVRFFRKKCFLWYTTASGVNSTKGSGNVTSRGWGKSLQKNWGIHVRFQGCMFFCFGLETGFLSAFHYPLSAVCAYRVCISVYRMFWFVVFADLICEYVSSVLQKISHVRIPYSCSLQIGCNYAWFTCMLFIFQMVSSQNYCAMMLSITIKTLFEWIMSTSCGKPRCPSGKLSGRWPAKSPHVSIGNTPYIFKQLISPLSKGVSWPEMILNHVSRYDPCMVNIYIYYIYLDLTMHKNQPFMQVKHIIDPWILWHLLP